MTSEWMTRDDRTGDLETQAGQDTTRIRPSGGLTGHACSAKIAALKFNIELGVRL